eukprot:11171577-Lingulodinium_polyedra.AAC.1
MPEKPAKGHAVLNTGVAPTASVAIARTPRSPGAIVPAKPQRDNLRRRRRAGATGGKQKTSQTPT